MFSDVCDEFDVLKGIVYIYFVMFEVEGFVVKVDGCYCFGF